VIVNPNSAAVEVSPVEDDEADTTAAADDDDEEDEEPPAKFRDDLGNRPLKYPVILLMSLAGELDLPGERRAESLSSSGLVLLSSDLAGALPLLADVAVGATIGGDPTDALPVAAVDPEGLVRGLLPLF
jgi:hypothetical protein